MTLLNVCNTSERGLKFPKNPGLILLCKAASNSGGLPLASNWAKA